MPDGQDVSAKIDQGACDIFLEEKCFQAVCDRTLCQKSEVKLCIRIGEGNRIAVDPDIVVIDVREQGIDLGLLWDRTCRVAGKVQSWEIGVIVGSIRPSVFSDQYNAVCSRGSFRIDSDRLSIRMVNIPDITAFFGVAQQIFIVPAEFKCLVQDGLGIVSIACQGKSRCQNRSRFWKTAAQKMHCSRSGIMTG